MRRLSFPTLYRRQQQVHMGHMGHLDRLALSWENYFLALEGASCGSEIYLSFRPPVGAGGSRNELEHFGERCLSRVRLTCSTHFAGANIYQHSSESHKSCYSKFNG